MLPPQLTDEQWARFRVGMAEHLAANPDRYPHLRRCVSEGVKQRPLVERLSRAIRAQFAWRVVKDTGVWIYMQNAVTGRRRVARGQWHGYQPINQNWVVGGSWEDRSTPPFGGSGVRAPPARDD